jgi:hypothetical protein
MTTDIAIDGADTSTTSKAINISNGWMLLKNQNGEIQITTK